MLCKIDFCKFLERLKNRSFFVCGFNDNIFLMKKAYSICFLIFLIACQSNKFLGNLTNIPPTEDGHLIQTQEFTKTSFPQESPLVSSATPTIMSTLSVGQALTATIVAIPVETLRAEYDELETIPAIFMAPITNTLDDGELWLVVPKVGEGSYVSIYGYENNQWNEISRFSNNEFFPGFLIGDGFWEFTQFFINQEKIWLYFNGISGAHGTFFALLTFDGENIGIQFVGGSGGIGPPYGIYDIDNDGVFEVVFDETNYYVICYPCSVREANFKVYSWDGYKFDKIELAQIEDELLSEGELLNNEAVVYAQANLWKKSLGIIENAKTLEPLNNVVSQNYKIIRIYAEEREIYADFGIHKLLDFLFYGDYESILEFFAQYEMEEIFQQESPILIYVSDSGQELRTSIEEVKLWIDLYTNKTITLLPEFDVAYFLRGWAALVENPNSLEGLRDIEKASELNPSEKFYQEILEYLKSE